MLAWIASYGPFILIPIVMLEGPISGFLLGILSSLGHFSFWWAVLLFFLAKTAADLILYTVARRSTKTLRKFPLTRKIINRLEVDANGDERVWLMRLRAHLFPILFVAKVLPIPQLATTVVIASGIARIKEKRFLTSLLASQAVWSMEIILLGRVAGATVQDVNELFSTLGIIAISLVALSVIYIKWIHPYVIAHSETGETIAHMQHKQNKS